MVLGRSVSRGLVAGVLALGPICSANGQSSIAVTAPSGPLLPASFSGWQQTSGDTGSASPGALSLVSVSKQALEECGPQRSQVTSYSRAGRTLHVEAIEFGDRTGAYSAYTLVRRPEMKSAKGLGSLSAVGQGAVLFTVGGSLVLASPATEADVPALSELAKVLPKAPGNKGIAPLLPTLAPEKNLVAGSLRYALGPATYAGEGGVLPANSLGWSKSAEAVTALYSGKHGRETLTLMLYPTPQIANAFARHFTEDVKGLGPSFANASVRRENELVMVASGALPLAEAQAMLADVHLRQEVTTDRYMPPVFHAEVQKTYSLLTNIAVLSGVMMAAAVLLGLFLGGGRALVRVLRGKSAAVEPEFLSLHLAPQNAAPHFDSSEQGARS